MNVTNATAADLAVLESEEATALSEAEATKAYQKSLELIFEVVLLSVVGVAGIIGNATLIALFSFQKVQVMKFHRLMMLLAFYDMVYIVLSLLLFTVPQVSPEYKSSGWHYRVLPRALPLAQISLTGSIYSTLAITIERYITVCHPFFAVSHKWSARRYLIPIIVFSVAYNLPKWFELETVLVEDVAEAAKSTTSNYTIEPTAMRINEFYIKVYCIWMNFVFMGLGPFCLLISLNALTLRTLLVQTKSMTVTNSTQTKRNEIALAKVSLAIVFVFIMCHSVKWIPNLYELARLAREDKRAWPPWVESTTHVSHFLMTVNSSVNFYIYCFKHYAGGKLRWLLPCCCFCCCCERLQRRHNGSGGSHEDNSHNHLNHSDNNNDNHLGHTLSTAVNITSNDGHDDVGHDVVDDNHQLVDLKFSFLGGGGRKSKSRESHASSHTGSLGRERGGGNADNRGHHQQHKRASDASTITTATNIGNNSNKLNGGSSSSALLSVPPESRPLLAPPTPEKKHSNRDNS